jgi:hypothetical protein
MLADGNGEFAREIMRLRALRRSFNCLVFTSGLVTRGDRRGDRIMSIGWWSDPLQTALRSVAVGERLAVSATDLLDATEFYFRLGNIATGSIPAGTFRCPADAASRPEIAIKRADPHRQIADAVTTDRC